MPHFFLFITMALDIFSISISPSSNSFSNDYLLLYFKFFMFHCTCKFQSPFLPTFLLARYIIPLHDSNSSSLDCRISHYSFVSQSIPDFPHFAYILFIQFGKITAFLIWFIFSFSQVSPASSKCATLPSNTKFNIKLKRLLCILHRRDSGVKNKINLRQGPDIFQLLISLVSIKPTMEGWVILYSNWKGFHFENYQKD